jgi:acetyl/propionyl-CoA carboxylase alpha subunit
MNEYIVTINSKKKIVKIYDDRRIDVDGKTILAAFTKINQNSFILRYGERVIEVAINQYNNEIIRFLLDGWYFDTTVRTKLEETVHELQMDIQKVEHKYDIKAPMPGLILKINKCLGDTVEIGESILVLEAMKMENDLRSPVNGTVKKIHFKEGQTVEKDFTIISIE